MWNTCAASPKDTSTARSSAGGESSSASCLDDSASLAIPVGASTKKSSSVGCSPAPATSMYPPAPSPVNSCSAANDVSIAPTAASTALPPSRSTRAPACAVSGCPAATTPSLSSAHASEA